MGLWKLFHHVILPKGTTYLRSAQVADDVSEAKNLLMRLETLR